MRFLLVIRQLVFLTDITFQIDWAFNSKKSINLFFSFFVLRCPCAVDRAFNFNYYFFFIYFCACVRVRVCVCVYACVRVCLFWAAASFARNYWPDQTVLNSWTRRQIERLDLAAPAPGYFCQLAVWVKRELIGGRYTHVTEPSFRSLSRSVPHTAFSASPSLHVQVDGLKQSINLFVPGAIPLLFYSL